MSELHVYESAPPDDADRRLLARFDEIEAGQLDLLDAAGKRIVELVTGLLGVLLAVLALGKNFPPPYLAGKPPAQILAIGALAFYLLAMLGGMWVVQPRTYKRYAHNLDLMREELAKIIADKARALRWAGGFFFAGSVCLAALLAAVILAAS
ncbi:MAG: hypothetical protein JXB47_01820 [Anaerolineae bacterium]|nr:hypothetical protein [Anaerolineae bacterium]